MIELFITRHGETMWNLEKRFQGWGNSELTENGIAMAKNLAKVIDDNHIDTVFTSPLKRAYETTLIAVGGRDLPVIVLEDLKEMNLGEWEGRRLVDLEKAEAERVAFYWNEPEKYHSREGEEFTEFIQRVRRAAEAMISQPSVKKALVVTHGMTVKALLHVLTGIEFKDILKEPIMKQTSITRIRLEDDQAQILIKGDTSHMEA